MAVKGTGAKDEQDGPVLNFDSLVGTIADVHEHLVVHATRAVNVSLTVRNWLIGFYIEEYEREGVDRATYGDRLMDALADALHDKGMKRCDRSALYRYRRLYLCYPQIVKSLSPQLLGGLQLPQTLEGKPLGIVESVTPQFVTTSEKLLSSLSYTHLDLLTAIDDPL